MQGQPRNSPAFSRQPCNLYLMNVKIKEGSGHCTSPQVHKTHEYKKYFHTVYLVLNISIGTPSMFVVSPSPATSFILISYDFRTFANSYCHFKNKHAIFFFTLNGMVKLEFK